MDFQDFLKNIREKFQISSSKSAYDYRNLVFKGGGVRGIAYMGALEKLDDFGVIEGIERVAGTSSGAIAATIVSFRLSVAETLDIFNTLDLSRVPQKNVGGKREKILTIANTGSYKRLFENFGWYSSEYFYQWISQVIGRFCDDNMRATFNDFAEAGFRDLFIVASNISRHRPEVFSLKTTPDVAVADAVRLSMSIPLYFEALRFDGSHFGDGDYYVDGGLYDNYPLELFDDKSYVRNPAKYYEGVNWETLGLFLEPDEYKYADVVEFPKNLWEFVALTGKNYYDAHQMAGLRENLLEKKRTITISDCGVSAVDFDIKPGSEIYTRLYEAGRQAVEQYLGSL